MSVQAPLGVVFDFFLGARAVLPAYDGKVPRKLRIYDNILPPEEFPFQNRKQFIGTNKGYFIKYRIELLEGDTVVYRHDYDCRNKKVVIKIEGALGDTIAWVPYVEKFRELHGCKAIVGIKKPYIPLFKSQYLHLNIHDVDLLSDKWISSNDIYAAYMVVYGSDDKVCKLRTIDSRKLTISEVASHILGLEHRTIKPKVQVMSPNKRPIKEKYVVIGAQAGGAYKFWNNHDGWPAVIKYLKSKDYRVVCIDQGLVFGHTCFYEDYPVGLEDQTGNRPLTERARWLAHADLFIGMSSGLSWLAWAVNTPVVMISGFSLPYTEFENPYRVINTDVCHGCWNDLSYSVGVIDWWGCPRHKGTPRQYECSGKITSEQVITMIDRALHERDYS